MEDVIEVYVTFSGKEEAERVSLKLLNESLIACAQILGPIRSMYWWKGKVEDEEEYLCIYKTRSERYRELEKRILELHSYEVPQIIAVDIRDGLRDYLKWIRDETG